MRIDQKIRYKLLQYDIKQQQKYLHYYHDRQVWVSDGWRNATPITAYVYKKWQIHVFTTWEDIEKQRKIIEEHKEKQVKALKSLDLVDQKSTCWVLL